MAFGAATAVGTVRLKDVSVRYGNGVVGLHPTTIGFAARSFTVLLGRSGAGKSTLLRTINLLAPPSAGTITAEGLGPIASRRTLRAHRRRTAMVFQSHQLIGRHSALRNVLLGRLAFHSTLRSAMPLPRRDRLHALECLERVGLHDKALERADALSGGQKQRVGIARALAQEPRLILADEPVASLDPATATRVLTLLRDICRQDGIACIVSLHQLDLARTFADRIVGLHDGRVIFDGAPSHLEDSEISRLYGGEARRPAPRAQPTFLDQPLIPLEAIG